MPRVITAWRDEQGNPVVYTKRREAEQENVEAIMERFLQFLDGERDFETDFEFEDYIVEVDVHPDGANR
jgi:hypothetical protein